MPRRTWLATFLLGLVAPSAASLAEDIPGWREKPIEAEDRAHWAFVPPTRPDLPAVKERDWTRNPIDEFILAGLEAAGIPHAPEADRPTLLRRLCFDLTGLPPTPEQLDAFL